MGRAFAFFAGWLALFVAPELVQAEQPKADKVYYMRKAFCEKEASAKHFGVHWVKRQRYIRKCLADMRR